MSPNGQRPTNIQLGCEEYKGTLRIDTNSGKYPTTAPNTAKMLKLEFPENFWKNDSKSIMRSKLNPLIKQISSNDQVEQLVVLGFL